MLMWLSIVAAGIALVALVALYYYFFDAPSIDEEEEAGLKDETPRERAGVLAAHREHMEEDKIDQIEHMVSDE